MNDFSSLFAACSQCMKMVTVRRPIFNGSLCNECYTRFARVVTFPSSKTLNELRLAEAEHQHRRVVTVEHHPVAAMPSTHCEPQLSTLEKLQFRKFVAEQGGMSVADVDSLLDSISPEERIELIAEFRRGRTVSVAQPAAQLAAPPIQVNMVVDDNSHVPCPQCRSKNTTQFKQGYGVGKAAVATVLVGPLGLLAGGINKNKLHVKCLACGHSWKP